MATNTNWIRITSLSYWYWCCSSCKTLFKSKLLECKNWTLAKEMTKASRQALKHPNQVKRHVKPIEVQPLSAIDGSRCRTLTAFLDRSHPVVAYVLDLIAPMMFTVFLSIIAVHFQLNLAPVSVYFHWLFFFFFFFFPNASWRLYSCRLALWKQHIAKTSMICANCRNEASRTNCSN